MVAFDILHNNKRLCLAGVGDFGVLTTSVVWVAHRPEKLERWKAEGKSEAPPTELYVEIGGLKSEANTSGLPMRWTGANLRLGDEVTIRVVDASEVDAAMTQYRDDPV